MNECLEFQKVSLCSATAEHFIQLQVDDGHDGQSTLFKSAFLCNLWIIHRFLNSA